MPDALNIFFLLLLIKIKSMLIQAEKKVQAIKKQN